MLILSHSFASEFDDPYVYKGQKRSLIDWRSLNSDEWLDYKNWEVERVFKDKNPTWMVEKRDINLNELVGKFISCIGECLVFRGKYPVNASFRTKVLEGDSIETGKDSFAWIFLVDGTLVQVAPQTSVAFKEINVSNQEVFYHVRLNEGHISWNARLNFPFKVSNLEETDQLFLPLPIAEANNDRFNVLKNQNMTEAELVKQNTSVRKENENHIKKLNELIAENNKEFTYRPSILYLVIPNGTMWGQNLLLDAFYQLGEKAYVKAKDPHDYYEIDEKEDFVNHFSRIYYRGYVNTEAKDLSLGSWYEIFEKGKEIKEFEDGDQKFHLAELLTKRPISMMVARELWLNKYSKPILKKSLVKIPIAKEAGYRLWNGQDGDEKSEIAQRIEFLQEYTRRVETTHLNVVERLSEKLKDEMRPKKMAILDNNHYYQKALDAYYFRLTNMYNEKTDEVSNLNEVGSHFWLKLNAKGNK